MDKLVAVATFVGVLLVSMFVLILFGELTGFSPPVGIGEVLAGGVAVFVLALALSVAKWAQERYKSRSE